ncbi:Serine protease 56 like protein [Argiope bruennichi]|uniref:Serine protease 56 like protein n=2 Tax=Argiope bruennichi TaxID=94029 RepID=A0A8T0FD47_ARGBR|nr:Serine protease 56 like protein [Argiope bruennichi]
MVKFVYNGDEVKSTEKYPWIVSFMEKGNSTHKFCGGMLISEKFVITAAHCIDIEEKRPHKECFKENGDKECFRPPESIYVGLFYEKESTDVMAVEVKSIVPHPKYTPQTYVNDIALVELKEAIDCKGIAKPICIPYKNLNKEGQELTISGWGKYNDNEKSEQKLMEGKVHQVDESECLIMAGENRQIICAIGEKTNQSSCQGDSGSAIFHSLPVVEEIRRKTPTPEQFFALGVTSVGPPDCSPEDPDAYTDIFSYRKWIQSIVKNLPKSLNEKYMEENGKEEELGKKKGK